MLKNYLKIAFKVMMRRKLFTFISLFGICFTLVVLIIVTAFFENTFGAMPPESKQDRILYVFRDVLLRLDGGESSGSPGYEFLTEYVDIKTLPHTEHVSVFSRYEPVMTYHKGQRFNLYRKQTDGAFWKIMDFTFIEGRPITDDDELNGNPVAVISESTRKRLFGNEKASGKSVDIDGRSFQVVGVVRDVSRLRINTTSDVWVPISSSESGLYRHDGFHGNFRAAILVTGRSHISAVKEEYQMRITRVTIPGEYHVLLSGLQTHLENESRELFSHRDYTSDYSKRFIGYIIGLMCVFMLLPTINLVSVNVSRMLERSSEIGIRKTFGASSRMLIVQFIVENVVLTLVGGIISFIISFTLIAMFNRFNIFAASVHLNMRIFFYGICLILFFGVLSGLFPAWRMSRLQPVDALRQNII